MTQVLKIFGCPGSGKSHELLRLFEEELQRVPLERIGFFTFTRSAKKVVLERSGKTQAEAEFLRTIHSVCYRQLSLQPGQLVTKKELKLFAKTIGVQLSGVTPNPWAAEEQESGGTVQTKADLLLHLNHVGRHRQVGLKEALRDVYLDVDLEYGKWFTQSYREWKAREGLLDYTDLLTEYLATGEPLPIDVLFIDEGQDLSKLQWEVVKKLGANAQRWYLCADDDQTIFSWAGASPEAFLNFPCTEEKVLGHSYRLPRKVLAKAQEVISTVRHRKAKQVTPRDYEGECRDVGLLDDQLFKGSNSTFLLFRNHHRGMALAKQLEDFGLPFHGSHATLESSDTQATLRGWKKALANEELTVEEAKALVAAADERFLKREAKDLVKVPSLAQAFFTRFPTAHEWPTVLTKLPKVGYLNQVVKAHGWERAFKPPITLMSIHQAKGQQAERVVLDPVMARKSFDSIYTDFDSEARVWFVAVTRASHELYLLAPEEALCYQL